MMTPVERHAARARAVAEAVDRIRQIETCDGVHRDSLAAMKAVLIELAGRTELFPIEDFPPPGPEIARNNALYRLSEDADHRFALYAQRSQGGTDTPAHDHTTWAIIVGVDGDELNRLYVHEAGGVRKTGEQVVGRGTGIAFMPDDLHSIHIPPQTPVLNFHMYGLALEQLHGRRYYRPATHDWAHFPASEGIRDLPAPAARSGA